ncbi:TnsD family Tn7-like transposition protein [Bacillus sp. FJAT-50079]|uniref:TnsD family Tn7-like transposition protein n=1 Tax=Bacillus sp. FJAT-50079 TaxID=2833577 RepID=UPI001BC97F90|nr:TnsD family Tn7-like transposition protein [Bacillus sp. FJAT-50079]MBS4207194.1 TniQ family protein [Bacillus sp. FJAT-50079]
MLAFFPKPYPDEDFRSIIHRYHIRSGHLSFEETNKELFNVSSKRNIYFHHNVGELIGLLNYSEYSIENFLSNHTIFPLINPFLSQKRKQDYQQSLRIKDSLKNKKLFQDYIAKEIKYCPQCLEEDYEKYGEVYSHRFHQLCFLNYCEQHQTELISICPECSVPLSNTDGKVLLKRPFCKNGHYLTSNVTNLNDCPQLIKRVLQDVYFIVSYSRKINRNLVVDQIYSALGKCGYGEIYSEYLQTRRLKNDFTKFVSTYVQILGVQLKNVVNSRFHTLLSKINNDVPNILANLLLIQFISNSAEAFFTDVVGYSIEIPFKNKPQPCLNKICKYSDILVIGIYSKKYYPSYVQGKFTCPNCGYTYGRKYIWNKDKKSGEVKKPFLISRGELWEKEVLSLYDQGLSLKNIARRIGLGNKSDSIAKFLKEKLGEGYIKRYNPKNNYSLYNINSRLEQMPAHDVEAINEIKMAMEEVAATNYHQQLLLMRRQNIVNIMSENPNLKRCDIEKLARGDYRWLKKNDLDWFNEFLPKPLTWRNKVNNINRS